MEFTAKQIAEFIQGSIEGDENVSVHTFAKIEEGVPGAISFLSNPKYTHYLYDTQSSIVLVNKDLELEKATKATLIRVDNAYEAVARLLTFYEMSKPKKKGIDPLAYIAPTAQIGEDCYVAPFAYIGEHVKIGKGKLPFIRCAFILVCTSGKKSCCHQDAVFYAVPAAASPAAPWTADTSAITDTDARTVPTWDTVSGKATETSISTFPSDSTLRPFSCIQASTSMVPESCDASTAARFCSSPLRRTYTGSSGSTATCQPCGTFRNWI